MHLAVLIQCCKPHESFYMRVHSHNTAQTFTQGQCGLYDMSTKPVLAPDKEMAMAVSTWRRAHRCRDGVEAEYTCIFKGSQSTGGHKLLVFKVGVCIAGATAEQELLVRSDHLRRGRPFPAHAYHIVYMQLAAAEHSRRCKVRSVLTSFGGDGAHTRVTRCSAVFTFPDIFADDQLSRSKQLVLGPKAVHNVVHHSRGIPWDPMSAARTEGLVCSIGFFDHLASETWPGLKYAGMWQHQGDPARNTFVRRGTIGRTTLEFDACWEFPQGHTATLSPQRLAALPPGEVRLLAANGHHRLAEDAGEPSASDADSSRFRPSDTVKIAKHA